MASTGGDTREVLVSMTAWTADRDQTVKITPNGPIFAKRGQVVVIAVLSAEAGAKFVTDMVTREQADGIHHKLDLTDTEAP